MLKPCIWAVGGRDGNGGRDVGNGGRSGATDLSGGLGASRPGAEVRRSGLTLFGTGTGTGLRTGSTGRAGLCGGFKIFF